MKTGSLAVRDADVVTTRRKKALKKTVKKTVAHKAVPKTPKVTALRAVVAKAAVLTKTKKVQRSTVSSAKPISKSDLIHLRRQPLGHLLVEKMLREEGFRGGVSSDKAILDKYSTDESIFSIRPQIVIQPKDERDVEIAVRVLGRETVRFPSLSLTPRAAGTGLSGGSLTDSIIIDVCAHMKHIGEVKSGKKYKTITVEPGAMWRNVEKVLKKEGVYLPPYPASKDICSIGGAIANNSAGPDSLRHGHCADWVESLNVTLYDGHTYTLRPITYKDFQTLVKKDNALSKILSRVFALIEKNERTVQDARPRTKKNNAGYALWDILDGSVASFKKGKAHLNLARVICGSQGTIGIITSITLRTEPINENMELIAVPVFDLADAGKVILKALEYDPLNIELFDGLTFDMALANPEFFRDRVAGIEYYRVLLSMYTLFHVRYRRKTPEFTLLISVDKQHLKQATVAAVVLALRKLSQNRARHITRPSEKEMFWQIRRASYTLSKFQDPSKRPAAFLEDMTVPPQHLAKFFIDVKKLLKKYNVTAAVHGHGGNGHLHFYPLLDFKSQATPKLVERMAEEFFDTAIKYDGSLCGEHNDGIIRTPHLSKMFSKTTLDLFAELEHIFDPEDIFNPGKKVNPRFDVKSSIRKKN